MQKVRSGIQPVVYLSVAVEFFEDRALMGV